MFFRGMKEKMAKKVAASDKKKETKPEVTGTSKKVTTKGSAKPTSQVKPVVATQEVAVKAKKEVSTPATKRAVVKTKKSAPLAHSVGRRKAAVARVWLTSGAGKVMVNNLDYTQYFDTHQMRLDAAKAFAVIPQSVNYDVKAIITGGGKAGQAGALRLGIARSLVALDESFRLELRKHGLLTVDSRVTERKKPGQKKARRKFQFVKR